MLVPLREMPARAAAGSFILHSGIEKWGAGAETAAQVHGMAAGAYPFLARISAGMFLKALATAEVATGAALLAPIIPNRVAGAALTGFSGGLVGLYFRTPGLRKPGSIWPSQGGIGISKDVWLLGIGLTLIAGTAKRSTPT